MNVIGKSHGIELHSPDDAYFSYFNSPYIGHSLGSAIDIYPQHDGWDYQVEAPINGRVVKIKKVRMGLEKEFPTRDYDFGLAIQPDSSDSKIVRILHVEPTIRVGEYIQIGDYIGTTIRSRYFNYWTGPHYHVEIMKEESFNRSSQSYPLRLPLEYIQKKSQSFPNETEFEVKSVSDDNIIGYAKEFNYVKIGKYYGISAIHENGCISGILDGGISHYKHGGVIGSDKIKPGTTIRLGNIPIGFVSKAMHGASFLQRNSQMIPYIDGHELLGLSCFIYPRFYTKKDVPQLVLVPKKYGQFRRHYNENDVLSLELHVNNNRIKT